MVKCVQCFFYILVLSSELVNLKDIHFWDSDDEPVTEINYHQIINIDKSDSNISAVKIYNKRLFSQVANPAM